MIVCWQKYRWCPCFVPKLILRWYSGMYRLTSNKTMGLYLTMAFSAGQVGCLSGWPLPYLWISQNQSTSAHVLACYPTAPSHYLYQCWLIINGVLRRSLKTILTDTIRYFHITQWSITGYKVLPNEIYIHAIGRYHILGIRRSLPLKLNILIILSFSQKIVS